jgi:hypothetical protein
MDERGRSSECGPIELARAQNVEAVRRVDEFDEFGVNALPGKNPILFGDEELGVSRDGEVSDSDVIQRRGERGSEEKSAPS